MKIFCLKTCIIRFFLVCVVKYNFMKKIKIYTLVTGLLAGLFLYSCSKNGNDDPAQDKSLTDANFSESTSDPVDPAPTFMTLTQISESVISNMAGIVVDSIPNYTMPIEFTGYDSVVYFYLPIEDYYYAVYAYDEFNSARLTASGSCLYKAWGLSDGRTVCSGQGNECKKESDDMPPEDCCAFVVLNL